MRNLTIKRTVEATFTAREWQLFTDMPEAAWAAGELNRSLEEAVATGGDREYVRDRVRTRMGELASFGASDTEPRWHLEDALTAIFGEED